VTTERDHPVDEYQRVGSQVPGQPSLVLPGGRWSWSNPMMTRCRSLFDPLIAERLHVAFKRLLESAIHADARLYMDAIFERMGDPDRSFAEEFQGAGFHSRLFELACFAYLEEAGFNIDRPRPSPDFIATKGTASVAIEAVTSNSPLGREEDIAARRLPDLPYQEILQKCNEELPIRMGSPLHSKIQKRYWHLPQCRGLPFVLIVGPFHESGSTTYVDESLARYLFGIERYGTCTERAGILVREAPVGFHSFAGKVIPSNFFAGEDVENLSAIAWCNQFTISRFLRIVAEREGLPRDLRAVMVTGWQARSDGDSAGRFEYHLGDQSVARETWARGVTVLHNPNAVRPLPDAFLPCTSSFRVREGRLVRDVHGFHPLVASTLMSGTPAG